MGELRSFGLSSATGIAVRHMQADTAAGGAAGGSKQRSATVSAQPPGHVYMAGPAGRSRGRR